MASMTDPMDALVSFQQALLRGEISLRAAELEPDVFVHVDHLGAGISRFTYVRLDRRTVKAFANIVMTEPFDGAPCFQVGVAVPVPYRSKGYAKSILAAAIAELKNGLSRNKIPSFYIEAVVSIDNEPSKRVAEALIASTPTTITDEVSGLPALHYVRKI